MWTATCLTSFDIDGIVGQKQGRLVLITMTWVVLKTGSLERSIRMGCSSKIVCSNPRFKRTHITIPYIESFYLEHRFLIQSIQIPSKVFPKDYKKEPVR